MNTNQSLRRIRLAAGLLVALALSPLAGRAQGDPPADAAPDAWDDRVVARHPGGEVTAAEWRHQFLRPGFALRPTDVSLRTELRTSLETVAWVEHVQQLPVDPLRDPWLSWAEAECYLNIAPRLEHAFLTRPYPEGEGPTEAQVAARFESKLDDLRTPVSVRFAYIYMKGPDPEKRKLADDLRAQLDADPGRFGELAEAHSEATHVPKSGSIGPANENQLFPSMAEQLFRALSPGELSPVIDIPNGHVIMRLDHRSQPDEPQLEHYVDHFRAELLRELRQVELDEAIDAMARDLPWEIVQKGLPPFDTPDDAVVLRHGDRAIGYAFVRSWYIFKSLPPRTDAEWVELLTTIHNDMVRTDAARGLIGDEAADELFAADCPPRKRQALLMQSALEDYTPSKQEMERLRGVVDSRLHARSIWNGRVLYIKPRQRASDEGTRVVPLTAVLSEIEAIRGEVEAGLDFEEAIRRHSTDPESRERGGLVSSDMEGLPELVLSWLRTDKIDVLSDPLRLPDGYALVKLETITPYVAPDDPIREHMTTHSLATTADMRQRLTGIMRERFVAANLTVDEELFDVFLQIVEKERQDTESPAKNAKP